MDSNQLDPRINALRADLAAESLRGRVDAPHYAEGKKFQIVASLAPMRHEPRFDARLDTEMLFGETLTVYDEAEGWAWAQTDGDSYVGYVPTGALSEEIVAGTHRVSALRSHVYPAPDIKVPPLDQLSMNACLVVAEEDGRFAQLLDGRFVVAAHIVRDGEVVDDFVAVAERFAGTPYLWGGRTSLGLDCSALVQLSLQAAGIACPRDTDLQEAALGEALGDPLDMSALQRGDLVFWEGHMGVMLDSDQLLHADAHHMAVTAEPVAEAISRIAGTKGPVTSIRRLGKSKPA